MKNAPEKNDNKAVGIFSWVIIIEKCLHSEYYLTFPIMNQ